MTNGQSAAGGKNLDWSTTGASAIAMVDALILHLQNKGMLDSADRAAILDMAIKQLDSGPVTGPAADNIRTLFNRP